MEWRRENLADWELHVVERGTKMITRLSGRTVSPLADMVPGPSYFNDTQGTWQFDSAALLLWGLPPGIADEIESLLHLVLYNGVRYLRNSVVEVNWFLMEFFYSFTVINNAYRCGSKKQDAMLNGGLWFNGTAVEFFCSSFSSAIEFPDHPLNRVTMQMLEVIKARYQVLNYQRRLPLWRRFSKKMSDQEAHKHKPHLPALYHEAAQKLDTHAFLCRCSPTF